MDTPQNSAVARSEGSGTIMVDPGLLTGDPTVNCCGTDVAVAAQVAPVVELIDDEDERKGIDVSVGSLREFAIIIIDSRVSCEGIVSELRRKERRFEATARRLELFNRLEVIQLWRKLCQRVTIANIRLDRTLATLDRMDTTWDDLRNRMENAYEEWDDVDKDLMRLNWSNREDSPEAGRIRKVRKRLWRRYKRMQSRFCALERRQMEHKQLLRARRAEFDGWVEYEFFPELHRLVTFLPYQISCRFWDMESVRRVIYRYNIREIRHLWKELKKVYG